jgi:hypothetical protein
VPNFDQHFEYNALGWYPVVTPRELFNGWRWHDLWDDFKIHLFSRRCLFDLGDYVGDRHDPDARIPEKICNRMQEDPKYSLPGWAYQMLSEELHQDRADERFSACPEDFWVASKPRTIESVYGEDDPAVDN